jgi:hypothetical protein
MHAAKAEAEKNRTNEKGSINHLLKYSEKLISSIPHLQSLLLLPRLDLQQSH